MDTRRSRARAVRAHRYCACCDQRCGRLQTSERDEKNFNEGLRGCRHLGHALCPNVQNLHTPYAKLLNANLRPLVADSDLTAKKTHTMFSLLSNERCSLLWAANHRNPDSEFREFPRRRRCPTALYSTRRRWTILYVR